MKKYSLNERKREGRMDRRGEEKEEGEEEKKKKGE